SADRSRPRVVAVPLLRAAPMGVGFMHTDLARERASSAVPDQPGFKLTAPHAARTQMRVTKRSGASEPVDVNKIVRAVARCCVDLSSVDPMRIALRTIAVLSDGARTRELGELSIRTSASFIAEETEYSKLAARLLANFID